MKVNWLVKLLCSIPVILLMLYYIPFLGVFLLLVRYFIIKKSPFFAPIVIIIVGLLLLVPECLALVIDIMNITSDKTHYILEFVSSPLYSNLLFYTKILLPTGIVFLLIAFISRKAYNGVKNNIISYFRHQMEQENEISQKNDMILKEKRIKAMNTHVVKCPNCGSDNILTEEVGVCKYCRQPIK